MLRYAPRQRFVLAFRQLFFFYKKKKCRESAISRSEASTLAKNFTFFFLYKKKNARSSEHHSSGWTFGEGVLQRIMLV